MLLPSPSSDYHLLHQTKKKITYATYEMKIPKEKLLPYLQVCEWRYHTEFPIVKTRYVDVKDPGLGSSTHAEVEVMN